MRFHLRVKNVDKFIWLAVITLLILSAPSVALLPSSVASSDCPVIVSGAETVFEGQEVQFQAYPSGYDSYQWQVNTGVISGPRNTSSITVLNVAAGSKCRATVTIRAGTCTNSASYETYVKNIVFCFPPVQILSPDSVEEGTPVTFTVPIPNGLKPLVSISDWSISAGTIVQGQGTASITVDTSGLGGQSITATAVISGLPPKCSMPVLPRTITVTPKPRPFTEYGSLTWKAERLRLDEFAARLQNDPGAEGYIIFYPSQRTSDRTSAHTLRVRNYLLSVKGLRKTRIKVLLGSARTQMSTELWIVSRGSSPPRINE